MWQNIATMVQSEPKQKKIGRSQSAVTGENAERQ